MKLEHSAFRGELPLLDPRLLPEQNAQVARNVYLKHGTLKPEKSTAAAEGLPSVTSPSTLYRYPYGNNGSGFWFVWGNDVEVDVVKSPLADDAWSRVYWTGDGPPKMAPLDLATNGTPPYPGGSYRLGIPAPNDAPGVLAGSGRSGESPDTALDTAYVVTLVSKYGEEGPPSPSSRIIERWDMEGDVPDGGDVEVSLPPAPSGDHNLTLKRVYRVESGGEFQFVGDVSLSTTSLTDDVPSDSLGRAVPSINWDMPDDRLQGLTSLPGGILAGFFDNTLCFSEAYRPHAWPVDYQLAFENRIVAIAHTGAGLVVATEGEPVLVSGSSPAAMAPMELDVRQPCLSPRSMVDMGDFVLYAGHDGLVAVGGRDAQVATEQIFSKDQWQELVPSSIHAYRYDGRYIAFYQGGCMVFTPGEGVEFFDAQADAGYYDMGDDTLYLIQDNSIVAWAKGTPMTLRWRSPIRQLPPGGSGLTCAKVIARDYPVTFRLIADGETTVEVNVEGNQLFRLPSGYALSREWEIELEGDKEIYAVQVASSPSELI